MEPVTVPAAPQNVSFITDIVPSRSLVGRRWGGPSACQSERSSQSTEHRRVGNGSGDSAGVRDIAFPPGEDFDGVRRGEVGGRRGDRTPDLCIANAALSQLS